MTDDKLIPRIEAERKAATGIGLKHVRLHYADVYQLMDLCKTLAAAVRAAEWCEYSPEGKRCAFCDALEGGAHYPDCDLFPAIYAAEDAGLLPNPMSAALDECRSEIDRLENELAKALKISGSLFQSNYADLKAIDKQRELIGQLREIAETTKCEGGDPCAYDHICRIHKLRSLLREADEVTKWI